MVDRVTALQSVCGPHSPLLGQAVLCDFIADGHVHRHVRRMRQIYGYRLGALQTAVRTHLAGHLVLSPIEADLQTAGMLASGLSSDAVATAAAAAGSDVTPLERYARRPLEVEGLLLGVAAVDEGEIAHGVEGLAQVCDALVASQPRPGPGGAAGRAPTVCTATWARFIEDIVSHRDGTPS